MKNYDEQNLNKMEEVSLDGIELLEDALAPSFGLWCGCGSDRVGLMCG